MNDLYASWFTLYYYMDTVGSAADRMDQQLSRASHKTNRSLSEFLLVYISQFTSVVSGSDTQVKPTFSYFKGNPNSISASASEDSLNLHTLGAIFGNLLTPFSLAVQYGFFMRILKSLFLFAFEWMHEQTYLEAQQRYRYTMMSKVFSRQVRTLATIMEVKLKKLEEGSELEQNRVREIREVALEAPNIKDDIRDIKRADKMDFFRDSQSKTNLILFETWDENRREMKNILNNAELKKMLSLLNFNPEDLKGVSDLEDLEQFDYLNIIDDLGIIQNVENLEELQELIDLGNLKNLENLEDLIICLLVLLLIINEKDILII
jgi:ABC-type multidrug transport system fused ATPase/permease subunit